VKVLVLTSSRFGIASRCLPALSQSPQIEVIGVVLAGAARRNLKKQVARKLRKTLKIGLLGALNGLRLRRWYADQETEDLRDCAKRFAVPWFQVPGLNSEETIATFRRLSPDLGISLNNSYIAAKVFTIPRFGMINVHGEVLPRFPGAQSVLWAIYEGCRECGFTIHQVEQRIDKGEILLVRSFPLTLKPALRETVRHNLAKLNQEIPLALCRVCEDYSELRRHAQAQGAQRSYTTPSFRQFLSMGRNHRQMYREAVAAGQID
jgi:methionyl-tRNA formyltransferase